MWANCTSRNYLGRRVFEVRRHAILDKLAEVVARQVELCQSLLEDKGYCESLVGGQQVSNPVRACLRDNRLRALGFRV